MTDASRARPRRRGWRRAEVELLRQWYPKVGPHGCLPILPGRGLNAIKGKAGQLGLTWRRPVPVVGMRVVECRA